MSNKEYNIKCGLKIWSSNKDLFSQAVELFQTGKIDFIELYIVPDSLAGNSILKDFKKIPITIHATHMEHGFDVFLLDDKKIKFFKNQIIKIADLLNSKFIVMHADEGDSNEDFKRNIEKIKDSRMLIENLPKVNLESKTCYASTYKQLKFIKDCGFKFCFDFSHAIKSAISQKINYKEFVEKLIEELNPNYFHICNGRLNNDKDEHLDLFDGEFDIKWIKNILVKLSEKKDIYLAFETPKGKNGLENDIKNIDYFLNI
ncbi:MAG: hypothetical protein AAB352_03685 [Patescibacteria group bacterium]